MTNPVVNLQNQKQFYSSIDGLRAICFIIVFFFHYHVTGFELGWSGVTVFFVISGFLITEILINSKQSKFYFSTFYYRRFLRIMPIYFLLIIGSSLLIVIIQKKGFPGDFPYMLTYTQNILWIFTDYHSDSVSLLAHTWTLAIEEQFYLIWPLLVWLIPKKHLMKLCYFLIFFGVGFRTISVYAGWSNYVTSILLFSQIDTLAMGGLLACYINLKKNDAPIKHFFSNAWILGILGIGLVIYSIGLNHSTGFYNSYTLFAEPDGYLNNWFTANIYFFVGLLAIGLIYFCINKKYILLNKILSNRYLVHLGKISYGLYLYHWPIYVILRQLIQNKYLLFIFGFLTTYLISVLSFMLIEKKFNALKRKFVY